MLDVIVFLLSSIGIWVVCFVLFPQTLRDNFLLDISIIKTDLNRLINLGALSIDVKAVANLKSNLNYFAENEKTVRLAYFIAMHYAIKNSPAFKEYINSLPKQQDPPIQMQPIIECLREKMLRTVASYSFWSSPLLGMAFAFGALVSANWSRFWNWSMSAPEKMSESITHLRSFEIITGQPIKAH